MLDGRIAKIGESLKSSKEIDASESYVLPGLIDIHTHGIGYESTSDGHLADYAALEATRGATALYPTLFSPPEELVEQMIRHRKETDELNDLPQIMGFRLESPYLGATGAGLSRDLAPISRKTTDMLLDAGGGNIAIWDISPELEGAPEVIRELTSSGIVCSMAHTHATIEQARIAVDAGTKLVTHLFDTFLVPEMTDGGVYPAGLTDYLLIEDRVVCEIIADGTHVHPLLVEKAFRCKSPNGIALVTDSNYGAGLPPGRYDLPAGWGLAEINGSNNGVRLVDRDMGLAGSALTPIDVFRNAVNLFGKDIAAASHACSLVQSRLLGLNKGEIGVGKDADLIILDRELDLVCTISAGRVIYQRDN